MSAKVELKRDLTVQVPFAQGKEAIEFRFYLNSYEKRLLLLESVYRDLLSDDFSYHIGSRQHALLLLLLLQTSQSAIDAAGGSDER